MRSKKSFRPNMPLCNRYSCHGIVIGNTLVVGGGGGSVWVVVRSCIISPLTLPTAIRLLMMIYHKQESEDKSWSMIAYEYMVEGKNKHHNILTPAR
jgi:hypothetical protein